MADSINITEILACDQETAFNAFVTDFQKWWPQAYSLSKEGLKEIGITPKVNGMCYEIGPHGFRCDWGRVLIWQPPERLVFTWQISERSAPEPNPELASEVHLEFVNLGANQTQIKLQHKHFSRHGEGGVNYCTEMASEYGWPYIISEYKRYCG